MLFDSHLHFFRNGYWRAPAVSPLGGTSDIAAYEGLRARHGIGGAMVVCYQGGDIDPTNNAYVRDLALTRDWIASLAYVAPAPAPSPGAIRALLDAGHSGIAVYLPDAATADLLTAWPAEVWEVLSARRAILSINAKPAAIARLGRQVAAAPGACFLFAHLGLPGPQADIPSSAAARAQIAPLLDLAGAANVATKLSGLYDIDPAPPHDRARPFVAAALDALGVERIFWGSDFSPVLDFQSFDSTLTPPGLDDLTAADRARIMGGALAARVALARGAG